LQHVDIVQQQNGLYSIQDENEQPTLIDRESLLERINNRLNSDDVHNHVFVAETLPTNFHILAGLSSERCVNATEFITVQEAWKAVDLMYKRKYIYEST